MTDRISSWADVYDMDLIIKYIDIVGNEVECMYSEYEIGTGGLFEIIGYVCPECGERVYFEDFNDWCVEKCPICDFDFEDGEIQEANEFEEDM